MTSTEDIINNIDAIINELIGNAKQLLNISTQEASHSVVQPLQDKQEELIAKLTDIDATIPSDPQERSDVRASPQWPAIQDKLQQFQKLNERFIENIRVRKGLIDFDIKDIKKRKHQLAQLKVVYGSKKSVIDNGNTKSHINTVS